MSNPTTNPLFQVAEVQLIYKTHVKSSERFKITTSKEAYDVLKLIYDENTVELREEFKVLLLNRNQRLLGYVTISEGGISGTVADPKLIFVSALKAASCAVICCSHNHPSGNLKPSPQDIELTKKLKEGCKILDITFLDHIIYTKESYFSFADEGLI